MKYISVFVLIFSIIISGCAKTPESPPTLTPKPTWTMIPMGTFKGCLSYEGKSIEGRIDIKDPQESADKTLHSIGDVECVEKQLLPGEYLAWGMTREGDDCSEENTTSGVGCQNETGEGIPFTIEVDQVTEIDIQLKPY